MNGIVKNLPDAEYRAAPGYGSTAIKWFLEEVPAQAKHWIDHPEDAPTFDAASVGQLVHALVLDQPHPFVVKDWTYNTKAGKARALEVLHEHGFPEDVEPPTTADEFTEAFASFGVQTLVADDFELAKGCAEGVLKHPTARAILERPGSGECSVFAEIDGVKVKARFDWLPDPSDRRLIALDLKTAWSAHPRKFVKNVANFDYAVQHAHYLDVYQAAVGPALVGMEPEMLFCVIDKRPPHLVSLVGLPELWAQIGREKVARARRIIAECQESGVWPGHGDGIHYLEPPSYYLYAADEQEREAS